MYGQPDFFRKVVLCEQRIPCVGFLTVHTDQVLIDPVHNLLFPRFRHREEAAALIVLAHNIIWTQPCTSAVCIVPDGSLGGG